MTTAVDFVRPSSFSNMGRLIAEEVNGNIQEPLLFRIMVVALFGIGQVLYAAVDLASWLWATITVRHMWRIGFWDHAANLTSIFAGCILLPLGLLFGKEVPLADRRPVYVYRLFGNQNADYYAHPAHRFLGVGIPDSIPLNSTQPIFKDRILKHLPNAAGRKLLGQVCQFFQDQQDISRMYKFSFELAAICWRQKKLEVLALVRQELGEPSNFLLQALPECYVFLGFDPNKKYSLFPEAPKRTLFVHAMQNTSYQGWKTLLSFSINLQIGIKDADGFDIFFHALLKLRNTRRGTDAEYLSALEKFMEKGSWPESLRFTEYYDFLSQCFHSDSAEALTALVNHAAHREHRYISLTAQKFQKALLNSQGEPFAAFQASEILSLRDDIYNLVQLEPQIVALWEPHRLRHLQQHKQLVSAGFREHGQDAFFWNETTGHGADIIAEYLMSEAPIVSQNPT